MSNMPIQHGENTGIQRRATSRHIADGVVSDSGMGLRISLAVVAQGSTSRSYVIRDSETTPTGSARRYHDQGIPTSELGWSVDEAKAIRQGLSSWAEDWEDPELDVYNVYLQG